MMLKSFHYKENSELWPEPSNHIFFPLALIWKHTVNSVCGSPLFYIDQNIHAALGSHRHFSAKTNALFKWKLCNDFASVKTKTK